MPHAYNRRAFGSLITNGELLIALYSGLVRIELALKDHDAVCRGMQHDLVRMLQSVGVSAPVQLALQTVVAALACTDRAGGEKQVSIQKYPDVRYVRHETDFPGKVTDVQLAAAIAILRDVEAELTQLGIAL